MVNSVALGVYCGYSNYLLGHLIASLDWALGSDPPPYTASPPEIYILPWETYIKYSTNHCMVGHCNIAGRGLTPLFLETYINEDILLT